MIEARSLSKRFGSTLAVDGLDFVVRPGHVTGFLGPNGAGKTTTMRMILGLDRPSGGSVTIGGRRYAEHRRPLHEVGALLDARAVHSGRSAANHLRCLAQSNGIPRRRVAEVLELTGLTSVRNKRAGGFSLGMSQRLGIAGALLGDPAVLIFDEPVNGLDPEGIRWIRELLRGLAGEGRTVFVSSHLMSEMALTADRVLIIGKGRLIADSSMADFVARTTTLSVLVRSPRAAELARLLSGRGIRVSAETDGALTVAGVEAPAVGDLAATNGIPLHELTPQRASLEAAFLELTADSVDYRGGPGLGEDVAVAS